MEKLWKPTREQIQAARGKTVPDVIAPGLKILFCGINPGLYTAAVGHHFALPGNRFWPALYQSGFTNRKLSPFEEQELLKSGYGIVNIVDRATASADELTKEELRKGAVRLEEKIDRYCPRCVAMLGISSYRLAFDRPKAQMGKQNEKIGGADFWVLPNPSGLNATYQLRDLVEFLKKLKSSIDPPASASPLSRGISSLP